MTLKKCFTLALVALFGGMTAAADNANDTEQSNEQAETLTQQQMADMGIYSWRLIPMDSIAKSTFVHKDHAPWQKDNWGLLRTNPGVKPFKVLDDLTFVGVPIFFAGWIAKSEKHGFRQQERHSLVTNFKTEIDDYMQFFSPALILGLKVGGLEGRSDWGRLLATSVMSYFFMDWAVTAIKYTSKEMRPNGTSANSWPSGHTAASFMGATMLHKEYGLTRSPWYSVAGYSVATATGVLRILNNAHWVSDVICGAGLGIMTTELAYVGSDLIFGKKGLLRNNLTDNKSIIDNPSFFSISMGMGWGSRSLDFDLNKFDFSEEDGTPDLNLRFGTSMAVGIEGAYFFNKHVGVGGRVRINTSTIKGWSGVIDHAEKDIKGIINDIAKDQDMAELLKSEGTPGTDSYKPGLIDQHDFRIDSDHLTEFTFDVGAYFNFPISRRFALGTKVLVGRSIMQEVNLEANVKGGIKGAKYDEVLEKFIDITTEGTYETTWDYFTVGGSNSYKVGTGISLTYAYKDNYAWKLFLDYDFSRKTYTMTYNPGGFLMDGMPIMKEFGVRLHDFDETQSIKRNRHTVILGGSFTINF